MARLTYKKKCDTCGTETFDYEVNGMTGEIRCVDCAIKSLLKKSLHSKNKCVSEENSQK